jgi:hypothetical protein
LLAQSLPALQRIRGQAAKGYVSEREVDEYQDRVERLKEMIDSADRGNSSVPTEVLARLKARLERLEKAKPPADDPYVASLKNKIEALKVSIGEKH